MLPTALIELKQYKQFVCWKGVSVNGRMTKVPYNPVTGYKADPTDRNTWVDYDAAIEAVGFDGIGFVLSNEDPYLFIDLDKTNDPLAEEENLQIAQYFNSYTEYSPNGGLHVICKGSVPKGKRNCHREIYSFDRYMTITGNTLYHVNIRQIEAELVQTFYNFLDKTKQVTTNAVTTNVNTYEKIAYETIPDYPQVVSDDDIWYQILGSANAALFNTLWAGDFSRYPSQSEADQALINILAFHSRNNEQVIRIFHYSALGQRQKAYRQDYISSTLRRARDQQTPLVQIVDIPQLTNNSQEEINNINEPIDVEVEEVKISYEETQTTALERVQLSKEEDKPPEYEDLSYNVLEGMNLIGKIASYLYEQSPRPSKIYSLMNAIGLMAGITGRRFNVSNTGLNMYLLLLGESGSGKEGPRAGINRLMRGLTSTELMENHSIVPEAINFVASTFAASGQGLLKQLSKWPCFLSWRDEFGGDLERIYRKNSNSADRLYKDILLSAFSKSGRGQILEGSAYSDSAKNIAMISSPAMSVLFASVPERIYEVLNSQMITDGFLPRFILMEETGETYFNDEHDKVHPSPELYQMLANVCNLSLSQRDAVIPLAFDNEGETAAKSVREFFEERKRKCTETAALWERAHLKTLKLAALASFTGAAVAPHITALELDFAFKIVNYSTSYLEQKFHSNALGTDDAACIGVILETVDKLLGHQVTLPNTKDSVTLKFLLDNGYVPYSLLSQRVLNKSAFRVAKDGAANALKRILLHMEYCGYLLPAQAPLGSTYKGKIYVRGTK